MSLTKWSDLGILAERIKPYPSVKSVESMFRQEGFWRGAIGARNELYRREYKLHTMAESMFHHRAVYNLEVLALYANAGCDLVPTREYKRWLTR
jgi:hypothetical protein